MEYERLDDIFGIDDLLFGVLTDLEHAKERMYLCRNFNLEDADAMSEEIFEAQKIVEKIRNTLNRYILE